MVLPSDKAALNDSEYELIYAPGSIQPHGILLVLESPLLKILQVSNNTFEELGIDPEALLDHFLQEFVESAEIEAIEKALLENSSQRNRITLSFKNQKRQSVFEGTLHQSSSVLIVELEPIVAPKASDCFNSDDLIQQQIDKIHNTPNLQALCQTAVEEVRRTIGFDRAIVYQFDATRCRESRRRRQSRKFSSFIGAALSGYRYSPPGQKPVHDEFNSVYSRYSLSARTTNSSLQSADWLPSGAGIFFVENSFSLPSSISKKYEDWR